MEKKVNETKNILNRILKKDEKLSKQKVMKEKN